MYIQLEVLQYLENLSAEIPLQTPNRESFIFEQLNFFFKNFNEMDNIIKLPLTNSTYTTFVCSEECVTFLLVNIPRKSIQFDLYHRETIVLLPPETSCCSRKFRIDPRHANVKIYDISGVRNCLYFHGRCLRCKTSFYPNFKEMNDYRMFHDFKKYFIIASGIGFSTNLLDEVSLHITIGNESFEKFTQIYNYKHSLHGSPDLLQNDVLEDNWLLYRILSEFKEVRWDRKLSNRHYFTEKICLQIYPNLKEKVDSKWLDHICEDIGCKNRVVVVDGNEKLYRYCCAMPFEKVCDVDSGLNLVKRCINNPKRGNQNCHNSKYCELHTSIKSFPELTSEQLDLRPRTRNFVRHLKEVFTSGNGCKSESNINKFKERTAGMLYLVRTCGIRLSHSEMYTAESLTSVFSLLLDVFDLQPNVKELSTIVYDRACDLLPYLERLTSEGNIAAKNYSKLTFIVDPFHAEKHTMEKCNIKSELCQFHPDMDRFKNIRQMNMEICEQTFHLINPIKHITRNMTYGKRLCFFKILDNDYNSRLFSGIYLKKK